MKKEIKERQEKLHWSCRFRPTDWWHEIGCPHKEWSAEELLSALLTKKEFEESNLKGQILTEELARKLKLKSRLDD